jgi:ADP-heptose:LPS heptosyltransferase
MKFSSDRRSLRRGGQDCFARRQPFHRPLQRTLCMSQPPRILVIRRRYLGDIVLLSPFFRNLRLHWPDAEISLLVEKNYAAVATLLPDVTRTLILPRRAREISGWLTLLRALRKSHFTHVFDLDNRDKTAVLTRLTGARHRIALLHEAPPRLPRCYTEIVLDPPARHERRTTSEYYLEALAGAQVPAVTNEVKLALRDDDRASIAGLVPEGGPRVLVHPGSRSAYRVWPVENFAAVCDRIQQELGAKVTLVGGSAEKTLIDAIKSRMRTTPVIVDQTLSIPRFAAFVANFDVMLCHDSGPMHVAAGVHTSVVALFGSQNATMWRPSGDHHTVLQAALPCGAACVAPQVCVEHDSYHNYCVRRISVDEVFTAVRDRLARSAARP